MRRMLIVVQISVITLSLLITDKLIPQDEDDEKLLQEAIQVIRDFVGNQSFTPLFSMEESDVEVFEGPNRIFEFSWIPGYTHIDVRVSPFPISIVGWNKTDDSWLPYVNTNLPEKSDRELLKIAQDYAISHFPGWNDFPFWQSRMAKHKEEGYGKVVRTRIFGFVPYFVNDNGDKIIFCPAGCSVCLEPYEGKVLSFYWHYNLKMTLTRNQLNPTISPLEAEAIAEEEVGEWIAQQAAEEGFFIPGNIVFKATLSDPNSPDQGWLGDSRLVIGATETSGLRLAYLIDEVEAVDANTGEVLDRWVYTLVDAHTGEVLRYPDRLWGFSDHSSKRMLSGYIFHLAKFFALTFILLISIPFVVLFLRSRKRRVNV